MMDQLQNTYPGMAKNTEKRRRISLSAGKKKEICLYKMAMKRVRHGEIATHFSKEWNVKFSASTISHILKEEKKWLAISDESSGIIRNRGPRHQELDDALFSWYKAAIVMDISSTISDEMLLNKAHELGNKLQISGLSYSSGWLYRFKQRHRILGMKSPGTAKPLLLTCISPCFQLGEQILHNKISSKTSESQYVSETSHNQKQLQDIPGQLGESHAVEHTCSTTSEVKQSVDTTFEEARLGLLNIISYLESNPSLADDYLETLQKLMEHIDNYWKSISQVQSINMENLDNVKGEVFDHNSSEECNSYHDSGDDDTNKVKHSDQLESIDSNVTKTEIKSGKETSLNWTPEKIGASSTCSESNDNPSQVKHSVARVHVCNICGKGFLRASDLKRHIKIHSDIKPHVCTDCGKGFSDPCNLRTHRRIHTGERPFVCSTCGKSCTTFGNLQLHMRHHTGEKPYSCPVCNRRFAQSCNLTEHVRIHTGERPYKCTFCDKDFTRSGDLRAHKRLHTGEKPYTCSICGKGFSRRSNLDKHKKIHTGEKPYKCGRCGRYFADKCVLVSHTRTHTGERPYSCMICGKTFSHSGSLYHHSKTHNTNNQQESSIHEAPSIEAAQNGPFTEHLKLL